MPSIRLTAITAAVAAAFATSFAASAGAVPTHATPAGSALARRLLLSHGDLGRGWTSSPAPKTVPALTCPAFSPALSGVVQTGAAISPTYAQSSSGPFASQTAYAYRTAAEEQSVWSALARPHLLACVAASLTRTSTGAVHFAVTGKRLLSLPTLPARAEGYRVTGTASVPNQTVNVYLDVILLGGGDAVTELSFSSFLQPVARALELRLARVVARRIAAG